MATITDWRNLATALNNIKANRNSTPGRASTTIANANTTSGDPLTIIASMDSLANNIDANDKTKFGFSSYNSSISTDNYYSSMDIKLNLLQKKIVTGTYCSANTTCNPNTITSCKPNTLSCSCQSQCNHSCSCQSQCGYTPHTCCEMVCNCQAVYGTGGVYCSCDTDCGYSPGSCCDGNCSDSCCYGDCSCDTVCTFTSCSHCNPYSGCSHTCSCFNVCTCVFV